MSRKVIAGNFSVLLWLVALSAAARAGEPTPAKSPPPASGNWLRFWCDCAPYCGKPAPCPPPCDYPKTCAPYCAKPLPCPPNPCQQWCPNNYCPKPPVCCFPGDPCAPCAAPKNKK